MGNRRTAPGVQTAMPGPVRGCRVGVALLFAALAPMAWSGDAGPAGMREWEVQVAGPPGWSCRADWARSYRNDAFALASRDVPVVDSKVTLDISGGRIALGVT